MQIHKNKVIVLGSILGLIIWFIDAFLDAFIFFGGNLIVWLFYPTTHEFWVRILILMIFILFSYFVQKNINIIRTTKEKLEISEKEIQEAYNRLSFYKDLFYHDINNVLQHILISIELYDKYSNSPEASEKLKGLSDIIKDQTLRGANLISNIRKISKIETDNPSLQTINFNKFLENSIDLLNATYEERDIKIQVDTPNQELYIQCNELFQDVCENILFNAIKHNDNLIPEIFIKIYKEKIQDKSYIKTEFIDNGKGIEDSRKKLIFLRGYNEDKSINGMGLGLSLVKKILHSFNGKIWVEDKVPGDYSKGSKFIILIPEMIENY